MVRLNRWLANAADLGRRAADTAVAAGRVTVDGQPGVLGQMIGDDSIVALDGRQISQYELGYLMLNKPVGYVCSRRQQGKAPTIYELLPKEFQHLKSVGRLDKDSSGLLLLTNDGSFAQKLSHPTQVKNKRYEVELDQSLPVHNQEKLEAGVELADGISRLKLSGSGRNWVVTIHEGRNRQIRRTFMALGCTVTKLHRTDFGEYRLGNLKSGEIRELNLKVA